GTLTLSGANSKSLGGNLTVNGGTLALPLGSGLTIGNSTPLTCCGLYVTGGETATFSNEATGTIGNTIVLGTGATGPGTLSVATAAHLTAGSSVDVGTSSQGTLTVSDFTSSVTMSPGGNLTVGSGAGIGTVNVNNDGTLTVGSGGTTLLYPGSSININ